jgi:hypothetical protein
MLNGFEQLRGMDLSEKSLRPNIARKKLCCHQLPEYQTTRKLNSFLAKFTKPKQWLKSIICDLYMNLQEIFRRLCEVANLGYLLKNFLTIII